MMENKKINAGFIVQTDIDRMRKLEPIIKKYVDRLIFVKKVPVTIKLEIKENFPIRKGENDRNSRNNESA